jgi:hypothetical protein
MILQTLNLGSSHMCSSSYIHIQVLRQRQPTPPHYVFHALLTINAWIEARDAIASGRPQGVSELGVELGADAATPSSQHGVAQAGVGPAVPADEGAGVEGAREVLWAGNVVVIGEAEAVGADAVLVIDQLGPRSVSREAVAGAVIAAVA